MRRIIRRTDIIVTTQTWTVTWAEDVPASEPSPAGPLPALPLAAPATAPETPPAPPDSNGSAE